MKKFLICTIASLALTACAKITQEQADAKMAQGCEAAINAVIDEPITEANSAFSFEESALGRQRRVTLTAHDEYDGDTVYSCLFDEVWSLSKGSHTAALVQVVTPEETIGEVGGIIQGDMQQFMAIVDAAGQNMKQ